MLTRAEASSVGAFVITYRRDAVLAETLTALLAQRRPPDTVLVVDNAASSETHALVEGFSHADVRYRPMEDNVGPAGAAAVGIESLLDDGHHWIWWIDDDDPPRVEDELLRLLAVAGDDPDVAAAAPFGSRWDWERGWVIRLPDSALRERRVSVDVVGGSAHPLFRSAAIGQLPLPDPRLFFGLEDWEYTLRLRREGLEIVLDGGLALEYRRLSGRQGHRVRSRLMPTDPPEALWRRYYTTRNYIHLMRNVFDRPDLARRRAGRWLARSLTAWGRGPAYGARFTLLQARGVIDGYRGRLGRTVSPRTKTRPEQG